MLEAAISRKEPFGQFDRQSYYQQVITSPTAEVEDKSFALYRAIMCYAPSGSNECGGEDVDKVQRKGWFTQLKTQYPGSPWAQNSNITGNRATDGRAQAADVVAAREHPAFWLWSGVKASDELKNAQTVYLHQGEVLIRSGNVVFQRLGLPVSRLTFPSIWLTVRFTTLDVPEVIPARIIRLMQRWQNAGNHVVGLQVDFDAATHQLTDYARFLQQLRQQLPAEFALGVTGLLDWAKQAMSPH